MGGNRMFKKSVPSLIIALTGGIGSGKSTVANLFSDLGVPIIDADHISREIVTPGSDLLKKIIDYFGESYLDPSGNLNRSLLRTRIFESPTDRQWLENILHPEIYNNMKAKIKTLKSTKTSYFYIICVIPLLFETGKPDFIDKVFVVDADEASQIDRIISRDKLTKIQAETSLKTQCSRDVRLKNADEIIENNGDLAYLKTQVLKLDQKYRLS
jgi:dephospho-CoA kinase